MKHDMTLNVLDNEGNTTDEIVPVSLMEYDDVLILEIAGVTVYVEKQGKHVGVYVSDDDSGRSDATLSLRVDTTKEEDHELRYDGHRIACLSERSA